MSEIFARKTQMPARWLVLLAYLSLSPYSMAVPGPADKPHATRQELIGAWRLVSIRLVGPGIRTTDPFFNADTTGVLIYDPSGWMSVQIAGQPRPPMDAPTSRPAGPSYTRNRAARGRIARHVLRLRRPMGV